MTNCCNDLNSGFVNSDNVFLLSQNHQIILSEICKIQSAILEHALAGNSSELLVRNYTPMTNQGSIKSVCLLAAGSGYSSLLDGAGDLIEPQIQVSGSGNGAQVSFTVNLVSSGIEYLNLENAGMGYKQEDTVVTVVPASAGLGTGADISVEVWDFGTNPELYFQQWTGLIDNRQIQWQLSSVLSHFRNLGYAIDILVNPTTMNTIMWKISF